MIEEFLLRARASSTGRAGAWLLWQIATSIPKLLFLSIRRWSGLTSIAVAVVAFAVLILVEQLVSSAIRAAFEINVSIRPFVDLLVSFAVCAFVGFSATWVYRGAVMPLAVIATIVIALMVRAPGSQFPYWYQVAFVLIELIAPIMGGAALVRTAHRSRKP